MGLPVVVVLLIYLVQTVEFTCQIVSISEAKKEKAKKVGKVALEAS